jgi:hypothetical protein
MLDVLGRNQVTTSGTGACGYNGIKQALGIPDIKQVMLDIKAQIQADVTDLESQGLSTETLLRDAQRVEKALSQVDARVIGELGWFSDFLAEYVARAYGVSILIIRESGIFTFVQVHSIVYY